MENKNEHNNNVETMLHSKLCWKKKKKAFKLIKLFRSQRTGEWKKTKNMEKKLFDTKIGKHSIYIEYKRFGAIVICVVLEHCDGRWVPINFSQNEYCHCVFFTLCYRCCHWCRYCLNSPAFLHITSAMVWFFHYLVPSFAVFVRKAAWASCSAPFLLPIFVFPTISIKIR